MPLARLLLLLLNAAYLSSSSSSSSSSYSYSYSYSYPYPFSSSPSFPLQLMARGVRAVEPSPLLLLFPCTMPTDRRRGT